MLTSEPLTDHLFAQSPECLGPVRVQRIASHAKERTFIDRHFGNIAVLAIMSADVIGRCGYRRPDRRRRALPDGFEPDRSAAVLARLERGLDQSGERRRQMTGEFGLHNGAGIERGGPDTL
jgi:hypothetical protein